MLTKCHKISIIILASTIFISLLLHTNSIDPFGPIQSALINEVVSNGHISGYRGLTGVPIYYCLGAETLIILGINGLELLYLPFMIIPYSITTFLLSYKLTNKNILLSSLIVLIIMVSGTEGTSKIFFWIHGLGNILLYTIFILLYKEWAIKNNDYRIKILIIILGIALVLLSYDTASILLIFIVFIILINYLHKFFKSSYKIIDDKNYNINNKYIYLLLLLSITILGISTFVFFEFIPTISSSGNIEVSAFEKFFSSFFKSNQNMYSNLLLQYSTIYTSINIIKYSIVLFSIIIGTYIILCKIIKNCGLLSNEIFTLSFLFSIGIYGIIRILIGQFPITLLFIPAIFFIAININTKKYLKTLFVIFLAIIIIMIPINIFVLYNDNFVNHIEGDRQNNIVVARWITGHNIYKLYTDEESRGLAIIGTRSSINLTTSIDTFNLMSLPQADAITKSGDPGGGYYLINFELNSMNLAYWVVISDWNNYEHEIYGSQGANVIYSQSNIIITHSI